MNGGDYGYIAAMAFLPGIVVLIVRVVIPVLIDDVVKRTAVNNALLVVGGVMVGYAALALILGLFAPPYVSPLLK